MLMRRKFRRNVSRFTLAVTVLVAGVLPNHLNCNMLVQDAVAAGVSAFITEATFDALTLWLRPIDALLGLQQGDSNTNGTGDGGGDPFEPPPAQP